MLRLVALALMTFGFMHSAAGDCAMWGLTAKVLTKANAELPPDGRILVMATPKPNGKLEPGDASIVKSWRFKGSDGEPTFTSIAPGLAVIHPPINASGRPIGGELVDGTKSLVVVKTTDTKRALPAAPVIKNIVLAERMGRRSSSRITVTLEARPLNLVGVVLTGPDGKPRSFGVFHDYSDAGKPIGGVQIDVFASQDCQALPNGTVPSKVGEVVTLRFVDDAGRVSAPSKPFKIAKAPTP
jgi:hypothetical protein